MHSLEFEELPGSTKIKLKLTDSAGVERVLTVRCMAVIEDETKPFTERFTCNLHVDVFPPVLPFKIGEV